MTLIEFIGFIVSLFVMVFLFFKQLWEQRAKEKSLEDLHENSDLDINKSAGRKTGNPPSQKGASRKHHPKKKETLERFPPAALPDESFSRVKVHHEKYQVIRKPQNSRASQLVGKLRSPQDMVLLKEIFGPPKALQSLSEESNEYQQKLPAHLRKNQ